MAAIQKSNNTAFPATLTFFIGILSLLSLGKNNFIKNSGAKVQTDIYGTCYSADIYWIDIINNKLAILKHHVKLFQQRRKRYPSTIEFLNNLLMKKTTEDLQSL